MTVLVEAVPQGAASKHVLVVRAADEHSAGATSYDATSTSLAAQTYGDWTYLEPESSRASDSERWAGLLHLPDELIVPDDASDVLVVVIPEGSTLVPEALADIVAASQDATLVTWDCDVDGVAALRFNWSPEALWSAEYTNGCFAVPLDLFTEVQQTVADAGLAMTTWTFLLHLDPQLSPARHLAKSLTRCRRVSQPGDDVAQRVIQAGLDHRNIPATCVRADGVTRLRWHPEQWPSVTIVIPTRHNETLLEPLLQSLRSSVDAGLPTFDVMIVDNGERTPDHEAFYDRGWVQDFGFATQVSWWDETPFHYGHVNNSAVARSAGDVIVLLNDDTRVERGEWLAELVGLATTPGIGCAGTALLDPDGVLQHAGVWLGLGGYAGHLFAGLTPGDDSIMGSTTWYRNVLAVTGACLAIRKDLYLEVGGLADDMILCGSDVALGLSMVERGLRNVCSPHPDVSHLESATRSSAPTSDQVVSLERYRPWHDAGDPFLNERVSLLHKTPRLRKANESDPVAQARTTHGLTS